MKRIAVMVMCAAAALSLSGCNWDTGSDAENWSSSYNWVNFSGVYRGAAGGLVVVNPQTSTVTPEISEQSTTESLGQWIAGTGTYGGEFNHSNIKLGTVTIQLVGFGSYSDQGTPGTLGNNQGTVTSAGGWDLKLGAGTPTVGAGEIKATYTYYQSNTPGGGGDPGSTRVEIRTFNVDHNGQHITLVDNTGAYYSGRIKQIRSTSGAQNTDITQVGGDEEGNDGSRSAKYTYYESPLPEDGDTILASFECSGHSSAGIWVKIVGTFEGTVAAGVFTGRTLNGTWLEAGGKAGDIYGTTGSVVVPVVEAPPEEEAP